MPFVSIGVETDGQLRAGAIFFHYSGDDIYVAVAASNPFIQREWVMRVLSYRFEELALPRLSAEVYEDNVRGLNLNKRLGFTIEGAKETGTKKIICFGMTSDIYQRRYGGNEHF